MVVNIVLKSITEQASNEIRYTQLNDVNDF